MVTPHIHSIFIQVDNVHFNCCWLVGVDQGNQWEFSDFKSPHHAGLFIDVYAEQSSVTQVQTFLDKHLQFVSLSLRTAEPQTGQQ